jgi:hypothetical protein
MLVVEANHLSRKESSNNDGSVPRFLFTFGSLASLPCKLSRLLGLLLLNSDTRIRVLVRVREKQRTSASLLAWVHTRSHREQTAMQRVDVKISTRSYYYPSP